MAEPINGFERRQRAGLLLRERRFEDAWACLEEGAGPPDADLAGLRGAIALGRGALDEAIGELRASLRLKPTVDAALNLSMALEGRGNAAEALEAAAAALGVAPDDAVALDRFVRLTGGGLLTAPSSAAESGLTLFFYQPRSIPYDGHAPRTGGLGGTESAVVYLGEALVRRGHRVVVFNGCTESGEIEGVEYAHWWTLPARCVAERPHVVVAVRSWELIGRARVAPLQIFWTGDAYDQPYVAALGNTEAREEIDFFMLQSEWQAETFAQAYQIPPWRILSTRLASASSAHGGQAPVDRAPRPRRLAYASTPTRGLDALLALFPRIRAACPDAELEVFSDLRVLGADDSADASWFEALREQAKAGGVIFAGSVPQGELTARLRQARVLAYPNHYPETFCVAAIEAEAAGCAVVTSALGALPQTVGDGGVCIPGSPSSAAYQDAFVAACVALLTDDRRWQQVSTRARTRAWRDYTWSAVSEAWDELFRTALAPEPAIVPRIAAHLTAGRAALACKMLLREAEAGADQGLPWTALAVYAAWHAGSGAPPSDEALRLVAIHFHSLRRVVSANARIAA